MNESWTVYAVEPIPAGFAVVATKWSPLPVEGSQKVQMTTDDRALAETTAASFQASYDRLRNAMASAHG